MEIWLIVLISVAAVFVVFAVLLSFAAIAENVAFGKRVDKNPLLKYFTAEDFGLSAESVNLVHGLNGYIYSNKSVQNNGKLVIFCHGMGPGHIAYTTEIAYFCNNGFTVLAVDNAGCNFSQGKNLKGMYSGVKTAVAAIDFARQSEKLKDMPVYLVGHSWGAYSALCASAKRKVEKVVAISAPNTPSKTMQDGAAPILGKCFAAILSPFWYILNFLKFGTNGNLNAAKCAQKNGVPTLLIHGDNDSIVRLSRSAYAAAKGSNVTKILAKGKAHNPYNTENAEAKLTELSQGLKKVKNMSEDERSSFFGNFDFAAATEEDNKVMEAIFDFLMQVSQ